MKHWTKKAGAAVLAGSLLATGLTGCTESTVDNSETVVTVNSEEVSYGVANFFARMEQASIEYYYESMMGAAGGADLWISEVEEGVTYEESVKSSIMESVQNLYLIRQHAEEYEVALTEEDEAAIEKAVGIFSEDNSLEGKELVSGDEEYVREFLELMTIQAKMEEPMQDGYDEEVSDEEAAQKSMKYLYFNFYTTDAEGNSVEMTDEEKTALKVTVEEAVEGIKDGSVTIDDVAAKNALEVTEEAFDAESTSPNAELVAAVDALEEEGEVTGVIETDYGYYIAVLTSLFDEEATEENKLTIIQERKDEQYAALLELWREEAEITVNEDVWAKVDFETVGVTYMDSSEEYDDVSAE